MAGKLGGLTELLLPDHYPAGKLRNCSSPIIRAAARTQELTYSNVEVRAPHGRVRGWRVGGDAESSDEDGSDELFLLRQFSCERA